VIREAAAIAAPSRAARASSPTGSSCASRRPGETFLDRMIAMVEGAKRQKTPNEIALNILLAG
jgi:K+-transporting ATPase ATPase B chain